MKQQQENTFTQTIRDGIILLDLFNVTDKSTPMCQSIKMFSIESELGQISILRTIKQVIYLKQRYVTLSEKNIVLFKNFHTTNVKIVSISLFMNIYIHVHLSYYNYDLLYFRVKQSEEMTSTKPNSGTEVS